MSSCRVFTRQIKSCASRLFNPPIFRSFFLQVSFIAFVFFAGKPNEIHDFRSEFFHVWHFKDFNQRAYISNTSSFTKISSIQKAFSSCPLTSCGCSYLEVQSHEKTFTHNERLWVHFNVLHLPNHFKRQHQIYLLPI